MRAGIRQKLIDSIQELKGCYEPTVPSKDTPKPYAVVLQGPDDDNGDTVGFKRTIEVWLYEARTTFQKLDALSEKVIKALDLETIEDKNTNETFTCMFEGAIGQDIIDEEWNAIARGLKFTVIALHEDEETTKDAWIEALSQYTENLTKSKVYRGCWKKGFNVPSILWRTTDVNRQRINSSLIKINKVLVCHVVSRDKSQIESFLDNIEDNLVRALKIPLDLKDRRYLTIESIEEDREADMISKGQLTVKLSRIQMIENNTPYIEKIYNRGNIK